MDERKDGSYADRKIIRCIGCKYYKRLNIWGTADDYACHYCIDTGKVRGYPAEACYKKQGTAYAPKGKEKPIRKEPSVLSKKDLIRKLTRMKKD